MLVRFRDSESFVDCFSFAEKTKTLLRIQQEFRDFVCSQPEIQLQIIANCFLNKASVGMRR